MSFKFPGVAVMADGRRLPFVYDQRDVAKLEVSGIPETAVLSRTRFVAWSSLARDRKVTTDFATFNELECETVEDAEEESTDADRLDPGRAGTNAIG